MTLKVLTIKKSAEFKNIKNYFSPTSLSTHRDRQLNLDFSKMIHYQIQVCVFVLNIVVKKFKISFVFFFQRFRFVRFEKSKQISRSQF